MPLDDTRLSINIWPWVLGLAMRLSGYQEQHHTEHLHIGILDHPSDASDKTHAEQYTSDQFCAKLHGHIQELPDLNSTYPKQISFISS